jgi:hypothetical protein
MAQARMHRTTRRKRSTLPPGRKPISSTSRNFAAILLLLLVAVEFGRGTLLVAPILVSLRFFLLVLSSKAERPNGLINLIYLAAILLAVGVVTLGIGLFQA